MKNFILVLFFLLFGTVAVAQQKALYSQYMTNYFLLNPAVSGYEKNLNVKAGYRNQWVGFEGAPKTFYVSGEAALPQGYRRRSRKGQSYHGVGGYVYTDNTGPTTRTGALLSYAYHIPLEKGVYLSSGLFAGFQQFRFDPNKINLADNSNSIDPVTNGGRVDAFMPDLSVGTLLHAKEFYAGVSLFQAFGNTIAEVENADDPSRLSRHWYFSSGYNFDIDRNITLSPSLLLKYVNPSPLQLDLNLKGSYNFSKRRVKSKYDDQVWAGISYRTQDALVGLLGVQFRKQYQLSYSYDITVSPMRHHGAGSHEIMFGYRVIQ